MTSLVFKADLVLFFKVVAYKLYGFNVLEFRS